MLRARKERGKGKRFILKGRVVISIDEVLVAIEAMEEATQKMKKKIGTGRPWGRPRKIQEPVVVSEDEDEDLDFLKYENIEIK